MITNRYLLPLLFCFFVLQGFSQSVKILEKQEEPKLPPGRDFSYIEQGMDTSKLRFVATYEATGFGEKSTISSLFTVIKNNAKGVGANSFLLISFSEDFKNNSNTLVLKTYLMNDSTLIVNNSKHEKNVIYIFSNDTPDSTASVKFSINDTLVKLKSGKYFRKVTKTNEQLELSQGGFSRGLYIYKRDYDLPDLYINLSGDEVRNAGVTSRRTGVTGSYINKSFSLGIRVSKPIGLPVIDTNLGILLTKLMKPSRGKITPPDNTVYTNSGE